jgi:hypothetical protein|tara:strand:- start:139 stop:405 length:267 start_codon:yes stop_codon:yes gene_type:complete
MLDKDSEIKRLTVQNEFLKTKLKQAIEGNITTDPIVNRIIRKHVKRHKEGMARFGKTMSDNDKPYKDWVKDAQEESMDFILYLEKTLK